MMPVGYPLLLRLAAVGCLFAVPVMMMGCTASSSQAVTHAIVTEGPPIPISTAGHAGGIVAGNPVVVGGSHWSSDEPKTKSWLHECFIFHDGKWSPGPSYPQGIADAAYATGKQGLYLAGGINGKELSNRVSLLSESSGRLEWKSLAPLPEPIQAASGAIVSNTFYVVGGFSDGKASNRLWAMNLDKPDAQWESRAPLPASGRGYSAFVAVGSQLYLLGGFVSPPYEKDVTIFGDAYRYDPAGDRWKKLDGVNLPGYAWTATAVNHHELMLTGRVAKISETSSDILLLDLQTFEVRSIGNLLSPNCCMPAIRVGSQSWWIPGGEPDTNRSRSARTSIVTLATGQGK